MIRAVALWAGLLGVFCVGCVPYVPPPPSDGRAAYPVASIVSRAVTATSCSKSDFLGTVLYQQTNPVLPIPGSTPSLQGDTFPSAPDYRQDLGKAWDAASDEFR